MNDDRYAKYGAATGLVSVILMLVGLGIVTPVGGLAFILGWLAFALGVIYARTPA